MEMFDYIADKPQFVVHGFISAGITGALDGIEDQADSEDDVSKDDEEDEDSEDEIDTDSSD